VIRPGRRPAPRGARRGPVRVIVIGAVVGMALAGCGAGQIAQTAYQANASGGATVTLNGIAVRDAQIAYDGPVEAENVYSVGESAPVDMHIINESSSNDRLISATSPVATSVQVSGQTDLPAGLVMVVGGSGSGTAGQTQPGASEPAAEPPLDTTLAPPADGQSAPSTLTPGSEPNEPADTSPTGALAPVPGEAPAAGIQPPPGLQQVEPSTRYAQIVLTGLREDIRSGLSYEIVLNFERAGQIPVSLPVAYPATPREEAAEE
jgi:copper(I)-binding protein